MDIPVFTTTKHERLEESADLESDDDIDEN